MGREWIGEWCVRYDDYESGRGPTDSRTEHLFGFPRHRRGRHVQRPSASNDGTKGGVGATIGGRMYLDGMPDPAVKIDQKSYDAGNPRDLARCHHMALVGCAESFSVFRRSLTGSRL